MKFKVLKVMHDYYMIEADTQAEAEELVNSGECDPYKSNEQYMEIEQVKP